MSMVGHAKRWNEEKGYGFITPQDGSEDIFCHRTSILDGDCLVEGTQVYYDSELEEKRNKQRAVNVRGGKQKGEGKGRRRLSSGDSLDSGDSLYSQGKVNAQQSYNAGMYTGPTAVPFPMIPVQAVYNAGSFGSPVAFVASPVTSPTMAFSSPLQIQVQMQPTYAPQPVFYNQSNQSGNEMPGTMAMMPSPQLIVADSYKFGDYED